MITILHIAEIILYIILAFNTGYLLLFAIASKFCRPRICLLYTSPSPRDS